MEEESQDSCYGAGSVAGAVIGTLFTTLVLLAVIGLLYRQWRRKNKGKHLVLVTDPEIVEDAYAFDNPCFKDATPAVGRSLERPVSTISAETPAKDAVRWSSPWSSLGLGSTNRNDKRRTLDDACLGPKATRVSMVSLRSRDFTGLGFNVCGNMRDGIFVKDLLHRGPASESGRIHPGDRIASVKISFRNMVYEDALTILSYASPYDVELEVESGGSPGSKPMTLLKKSIGPSPTRICHPLYRSQSIPDLSQSQKSTTKRLFVADPNESLGSNYSTMNSTLKSSKSTGGNQTLERHHEESTSPTTKNNHQKFGIRVLPALDGTVHRIENQNEHNTNLERRHSKKLDAEKHQHQVNTKNEVVVKSDESGKTSESLQQKENASRDVVRPKKLVRVDGSELNGIDVPDKGLAVDREEGTVPSEVPEEVHNAAMAARRNRKSSSELPRIVPEAASQPETDEAKSSLQKNKRKAPSPPKSSPPSDTDSPKKETASPDVDDKFDSITDYTESLSDYVNKIRESSDGAEEARRQRLESQAAAAVCLRSTESDDDTDSEVQNSFTTIELNPADITIHHTPVPEVDDDDENDDVYRKAASLGDLSKYENKRSTTLERAQSLDMTDTGSKKRKAPLPPPEDIHESTEDLTKLDQMDTFERRKLKKSTEWGTLEDAIWQKTEVVEDRPRVRKKSNGTLERSKSAVEIKLKEDTAAATVPSVVDRLNSRDEDAEDTSAELYNLPLSKRLTRDFIRAERMFDPSADNSLARIVNDGVVVKSPTLEEMELDFRQAKPLPDDEEDDTRKSEEEFGGALRDFDVHVSKSPSLASKKVIGVTMTEPAEGKKKAPSGELYSYEGKKEVVEDTITKITVDAECPSCERRFGRHDQNCERHSPLRAKSGNDGDFAAKKSVSVDKPLQELPTKTSPNGRFDVRGSSIVPQSLGVKFESPVALAQHRDVKSDANDSESKTTSAFQAHRVKFESTSEAPSKPWAPTNPSKSPTTEPPFEMHFAKRIVNVVDDRETGDGFDSSSGVTVNNRNVSLPATTDRHVSNVSVSSGEVSDDGATSSKDHPDQNRRLELDSRPPLPNTPMPQSSSPQKMTYITEIKVSTSRENVNEPDSENEEIVAIMEGNPEVRKQHGVTVTSNGKPTPGKKPPIPPRRSDAAKVPKDDSAKQVVYVSEYKSASGKDPQVGEVNASGINKQPGAMSKKFEQWVFLEENKENPWGNGSSQPQPVTNIVLSSTDQKIIHQ